MIGRSLRSFRVAYSGSSGPRKILSGRTTAAGLAAAAQDFGQDDDITVLTVALLAAAA
jgi:hypothetical protein